MHVLKCCPKRKSKHVQHVAMGQKKTGRKQVSFMFPFCQTGFFRYSGLLTHSHVALIFSALSRDARPHVAHWSLAINGSVHEEKTTDGPKVDRTGFHFLFLLGFGVFYLYFKSDNNLRLRKLEQRPSQLS